MEHTASLLLLSSLIAACDRAGNQHGPGSSTSASAPTAQQSTPAAALAGATPPGSASATLPRSTSLPCPEGMLLVDGQFCPVALQVCIHHSTDYEDNKDDPTISERCVEFQAPSKCVSKERKHLRFCVDRYEWPNKKGELPLVLVQWGESRKKCESVGKRLCDEEEWLFACEGEQMLPYVYGYVRDPKKCQIDRPYVQREIDFKRYELCQADPDCKAKFAKIDQRKPAGSFPECISPFGAYDMNGSVNEWVNLPGNEYPDRSGLKGGWWGPVRSRCRPTVKFHKEEDWGYEAGFRCCKSADLNGAPEPVPDASAPPHPIQRPERADGAPRSANGVGSRTELRGREAESTEQPRRDAGLHATRTRDAGVRGAASDVVSEKASEAATRLRDR